VSGVLGPALAALCRLRALKRAALTGAAGFGALFQTAAKIKSLLWGVSGGPGRYPALR